MGGIGAGGMSAGSSATNGDFGADSSYKVGNMTFGAVGANSSNNQLLVIGAIALIGFMLWKKK